MDVRIGRKLRFRDMYRNPDTQSTVKGTHWDYFLSPQYEDPKTPISGFVGVPFF